LASAVSAILISVIVVGAIVGAAYCLTHRRPVRFRSLDEQVTFGAVARWAARELDIRPNDPRLRYALSLWIFSSDLNWLGSVPVEELALVAPFIDPMIEGKGPPPNIPPDYKDGRPQMLTRFKERMIAQGLWPKTPS
jgi:hypothetical protein